jgi:uncharacterized membrane protein
MKKINIVFLLLAFLTACFIILIGVAIGERSILGIFGAIFGVIVITGVGFTYKRRLREKE